jgi:hypothetical protein
MPIEVSIAWAVPTHSSTDCTPIPPVDCVAFVKSVALHDNSQARLETVVAGFE